MKYRVKESVLEQFDESDRTLKDVANATFLSLK